jgi:hypothetical protein
VRVVPLVRFDIVILAAGKLHLFVLVVSTKCVYNAFAENGREESLLIWHAAPQPYLPVYILQVRVAIAVTTKDKPRVRVVDVNDRVVARVIVAILAAHTPLEIVRFDFHRLLIREIAFCQHCLVATRRDKLGNLKRHTSDTLASIFKPHGIGGQIAVQVVLL